MWSVPAIVALWLSSDLEWHGKVALCDGTLGRAAVVKDLAVGVSMHLSPYQDP